MRSRNATHQKEIARVELELLREKQRVEIGTKIHRPPPPRPPPKQTNFFVKISTNMEPITPTIEVTFDQCQKPNPKLRLKIEGTIDFFEQEGLTGKEEAVFRANGGSHPIRL